MRTEREPGFRVVKRRRSVEGETARVPARPVRIFRSSVCASADAMYRALLSGVSTANEICAPSLSAVSTCVLVEYAVHTSRFRVESRASSDAFVVVGFAKRASIALPAPWMRSVSREMAISASNFFSPSCFRVDGASVSRLHRQSRCLLFDVAPALGPGVFSSFKVHPAIDVGVVTLHEDRWLLQWGEPKLEVQSVRISGH